MSPAPAHSVTDQFARTPTGGAGMTDRHTANTITDDALDALYTELERLRAELADVRASLARYERDETARLKTKLVAAQQHQPQHHEHELSPATEQAELGRLRAQQAGFFAQMAAARAKSRWFWQRAQAAERALERVQAVVTERRTEVAEFEAEHEPSAWSDAVTVTCDRIDDALRAPSPSVGIHVDGQQQEAAR